MAQLKIGLLTTWNTRCGIAEYSRYIAQRMRARDDIELVVLGSRNRPEMQVRPNEDFVLGVFDSPFWGERRFQLDVDRILAIGLDVLHVQYSMYFFDARQFEELIARFEGKKVVTFHDNDFPPVFSHDAFDLRYSHRRGVGRGECELIPHGVENRPPVVKTFGLGRSRDDIIAAVCDRNGWRFEKFFGGREQRWLEADDLYRWLRDSDAIVLWYDETPGAGSSGAVRIAISTRRHVVCNDTLWFAEVTDRGPNWAKVSTPAQLESELRATFANELIERDSWERIVERHATDYARLAGAPARVPGARDLSVLAFADELLQTPALLRAWSSEFSGGDPITLVIDATGCDTGALATLAADAGIAGDEDADVLAVMGPDADRARLAAGALDAVFSRRAADGSLADLRHFDDGALAELRRLLDAPARLR